MKLTEIIRSCETITHKRYSLDDFDTSNKIELGYIIKNKKEYPIFECSHITDKHVKLIWIDDGTIICSIIGIYFNNNHFAISDLYTNKNYRNQGFGTSLYQELLNLGITLVSDYIHSTSGEKFWKSLVKKFPNRVKVFNAKTKEKEIYNPNVHDPLIYSSNENGEHMQYRLILEGNDFIIPKISRGILIPY